MTTTKKLTKKERRLAVAKDVLKRMRCRTIKENVYLSSEDQNGFKIKPTVNLQQQITTLEKNCEVCALGSCLLSQIRLFNKVDIPDINEGNPLNEGNRVQPGIFSQDILRLLKDTFSPQQMCLIEAAFEMDSRPPTWWVLPDPLRNNVAFHKKLGEAAKFGEQIHFPDQRLTAIMKNLLANDGEFEP